MACDSCVPRILLIVTMLVLTSCKSVQAGDESVEQNLQRLEKMTDAEKTEFLQKKRRFDELTPQEKQRLRELYARLQKDPDRERLMKILRRYSEWLKTLPPGERAQLLSLPAEQRIEKIKEIQRTRETQRFNMMVDGRLKRNDRRAILKWVDQYVREHYTELLAKLPKSFRARAKGWQQMNEQRRQHMLGFVMLRYSSSISLTPEDEKQLRAVISREAQEFLDKLKSDEERRRVLWTWIRAALFSRVRPPVGAEELRKFFLERLDPAKREYLESLPRDQMLRELQNLYWREASHNQRRRRLSGGRPGFGASRPNGKMPPAGSTHRPGQGHSSGPGRKEKTSSSPGTH